MDKKNKELTRDDEIVKASIDYDIENGLQSVVGCNSVLKDYEYIYFNQNRAFVAGAKWADKTFVEKLKVELNNRLKNYGHPYGSTAEQRILWRSGWDMCIKNIENFIEDFLTND